MTITLGLGLQAIGIILEGIGLFYAFRSFGTVKDRWLRDGKKEGYALIPEMREQYEKEGRIFVIQVMIIMLGLALQLVGLFVS